MSKSATSITELAGSTAETILLVEDEAPHALLIRRAFELRRQDYSLRVVRTLGEAREFIRQSVPSLIIADYRLPDGDGTELLSVDKGNGTAIPVVIMTGQGDEQIAVATMRAGALDYIVKSDTSMADMPHIADRALREWDHINQRSKAEQALLLSEERYALAAMAANDGLWDWNLQTDSVYYSPRMQSMLGFADGEMDDTPDAAFALVHTDDLEHLKAAIDSHLEGGTPHFACEFRMHDKQGESHWVLMRGMAVRGTDGTANRMAGSLTDITKRKLAEQQLQHDALHDVLTGLPNRALFMDRLGLCLERAQRRDDYRCAVLFIDLDRFKVVNDSLGHVVGDNLLKAVAERLLECLRSGDTVCRFGGDEFAILLDGIERDDEASQIANRIAQSIEQTYRLGEHDVFTTASIGIALNDQEYRSAADIIRDADTAMFRAKARGRGLVELFKHTMRLNMLEQLHLENDLRKALEHEELVVFYQPIVSLENGSILGFEALVRWQHPHRGLINPLDFIPLAEEIGLINALGSYVLECASREVSRWQRQFSLPNLSVSVNLSAKQFVEADLVDQIMQALERTSLNPACLKLEITENLVMENTKIAAGLLTSLRRLGIGLAMDDFGTGYSSLSYLHRFPVDTLKIDRSFVSRMDMDDSGLEIVRTIVALARTLKINVTAEGVENASQLQLLRALQCPMAQGFYFSKPVGAASTEALLKRNPRW